mgnify:CR=1 FL=1
MKLYYDFHIHTCLSPCGDADNTPNNIVNMALIKGLNAIAIADHNTGKNCPAAVEAGRKNGLVVLPAMELTTSEDIHVLCLFERCEDLAKLEAHIASTRLRIRNRPEIFGRQLILNAQDEPIGEEEDLLIVSSGVSVEEVAPLVKGMGGIAVPAHIDKQSNGLVGILGAFDYGLGFEMIECARDTGVRLPRITDSDAHYLWDIAEAEHYIEAETCSAHGVFSALRKMCEKGVGR